MTWFACFALTLASAVFPWINAEIIVLALPAVAPTPSSLAAMVLVATAGQMTGKAIVYWIGRSSSRWTCWSGSRMAPAVEKWRGRCTRPSRAAGLVFLSSSVGWPPFFAVTAVAGALKINFPSFMAAGTAGRLLRFGALVFVPHIIGAMA